MNEATSGAVLAAILGLDDNKLSELVDKASGLVKFP